MKTIRKNEEAVSPVIGVILMVAITVILAAVIAAFVFGMGPPAKAPQASIRGSSVDTAADTITLEHQGGDNIVLGTTKLIIDQGTNRTVFATMGNATASPFIAGDKMVIDITTTNSTISINNLANQTAPTPAAGGFDLSQGAEVTVTLIDITSSQQIGNIKIRA